MECVKDWGGFEWSGDICVYACNIVVQGDWEDRDDDFTFRSIEWRDWYDR